MKTFALFGAGFIGKVHGANIAAHPRAKLGYVYDTNQQAAEQLAEQYGAQAVSRPDDIWSAQHVDAVVIASSTNTHADLLSSALDARKPVYCEKPIDLDIARVKRVAQEWKSRARPLVMLGFSRRFDPNHRGVREAVQAGKIGTIELMHFTTRGPQPPPIEYIKVSGGQFRDQTIHFFDLLCWITGQAPVEVYATGAALVDPRIGEAGDIDTSMLVLTMQNGALCHIDNSRRSAYGYDERIEVFGSAGMVQSNRKPVREVSLYSGTQIISDGLHAGWFERLQPSFAVALDTFVSALEGQTVEYPSLMDGLRAQIVAEAAVESLRRHVPVPIRYWEPG